MPRRGTSLSYSFILLVTVARLAGPGGLCSVVAESVLVRVWLPRRIGASWCRCFRKVGNNRLRKRER